MSFSENVWVSTIYKDSSIVKIEIGYFTKVIGDKFIVNSNKNFVYYEALRSVCGCVSFINFAGQNYSFAVSTDLGSVQAVSRFATTQPLQSKRQSIITYTICYK